MNEQDRDIFFNIINRFVGVYSREASRATINKKGEEYPFVAMDTRQVMDQIRFAGSYLNIAPDSMEPPRHRFIDVGCGIGNVLLIAEQFGFDVYGIEKDTYPFEVATKLIGEDRVSQDDIWTYAGYNTFDVIYYFRPFSDREPQLRFERLIEDSMKVGGILIANHKNSDAISEDKRFTRLNDDLPIWQKIAGD